MKFTEFVRKGISMSAYNFEEAKEKYRHLCREEPSVNIYMQDWYLDGAVDKQEDWRVILCEEDGAIQAAFPFQYTKKHGMHYIENPWNCARMGIWMRQRNYKSKLDELLTHKHLVEDILEKLPVYDVFRISFHSGFGNWLPFYWNGYSEQGYYSMIIHPTGEELLPKVNRMRRRQIRGGQYVVNENKLSIEGYCSFLEKSYESRGKQLTYDIKKLARLLEAVRDHNACTIYSAENNNGDVIAANVVIRDAGREYLQFLSQIEGKEGNSQSALVFHSIGQAVTNGRCFDFEGSMLPGVCEFYASYNPEWETYHMIYKYSMRYRLLDILRRAGERRRR